ncbi:MAG: serine acetyltransferase [Deltaproteobacteria bacterium]|nr:serine acetyltransferase [Deltaproteobacteria bacterium]
MPFLTSLGQDDLSRYVARQLSVTFPDRDVGPEELRPHVATALARVERCFSEVKTPVYFDGATARFNHLHGDQYAAFLYLLSNSIFRANGDLGVATKTYLLNKALHALDVFYEVALPEVFCFQHPVGTVLGRAQYEDHLFVYQRVAVGANLQGRYPRIGRGVCLFGGSAVTGDCRVGANTYVSIGTVIWEQDVPGDCITFGRSPHLVHKPMKRSVIGEMFGYERPPKAPRT